MTNNFDLDFQSFNGQDSFTGAVVARPKAKIKVLDAVQDSFASKLPVKGKNIMSPKTTSSYRLIRFKEGLPIPRLGPHSINFFAICSGKALFKGGGRGLGEWYCIPFPNTKTTTVMRKMMVEC